MGKGTGKTGQCRGERCFIADTGHLDGHAAKPEAFLQVLSPQDAYSTTTMLVRWARLTSEPYMPLMMTALCVPSAGCRQTQEAFQRGGPASTNEE